MKRIVKYYIFILPLCILYSSEITDNAEKQIKDHFDEIELLEWSMFQISKDIGKEIQNTTKQKFFRKEVNLWKIITTDSDQYYAILDNVIGKTMPITFLCIFNPEGLVEHVSVIKYREPYGGEVGNRSWLNQFLSYTNHSKYKVGNDISAISWATLSVNSVTKGIRK